MANGISAAVVPVLLLFKPMYRTGPISETVNSRNPLPEIHCCCDTAPASWQPSQPPVFCKELPFTATFTGLIQTTFSEIAPPLLPDEDELLELEVDDDELLLLPEELEVLLAPLLDEELELDELDVLLALLLDEELELDELLELEEDELELLDDEDEELELLLEDEPPPKPVTSALITLVPELIREASIRKG
jgi:hypothetical protein